METYKSPTIANRPPQVVDSSFYGDYQFDPDSANPTYIGMHKERGASDSDENWKIYKFISNTRIQLAYGSWTGRAGLF